MLIFFHLFSGKKTSWAKKIIKLRSKVKQPANESFPSMFVRLQKTKKIPGCSRNGLFFSFFLWDSNKFSPYHTQYKKNECIYSGKIHHDDEG